MQTLNSKKIIKIPDESCFEIGSTYTYVKKSSYDKSKPNQYFKWVNTPCSIKELMYTEDFSNYLTTKILFFHNKSPSCNDLINKRLKLLQDKVRVISLQSKNLKLFKNSISENYDNGKRIYIIEISSKRSISTFLKYINSQSKKRNYAIWIKGYIDDILEFIPIMFDGMFIFDTSKYELELLKKRLSISDKTIKFLKENQNDITSNESVLFYWNYERCTNAPSLYVNPIILGMGRCLDYRKMYNYENTIERNVYNSMVINQTHSGSGDNVGGDKSVNAKTNIENIDNKDGGTINFN